MTSPPEKYGSCDRRRSHLNLSLLRFEALSFAEECLKTREERGKYLFQGRTRTPVFRFEQISTHQTTTDKSSSFLRSPQGLPNKGP